MTSIFFIVWIFASFSKGLCQISFAGHKVLSFTVKNEKDLEFLSKLSTNEEVDIWNEPFTLNERVDIRVPPEISSRFEEDLKSNHIHFEVLTDDLQKWIDEEREENPVDGALSGKDGEFQLDSYHTFDAISSHIDDLGERYSSIASVQEIGKTFEGNPIKGLKIGSPGKDKPAIWIDSGIHAREWVAPATNLYIMEHLLKGYDTDPEVKDLVDTFDWYIFPVMNPDGYKYTWSFNRMWRKNRSMSAGLGPEFICRGVDPNRNFNSSFGGPSTSSNPCSDIYCGDTPFSEIESRAIRDGVTGLGDRLKAYFTLHSYSQLWMTPYGHSRDRPPHHEDQMKAMAAACKAIADVHGEEYRYGTISETIYPAAGSSVDWAYESVGVKYSFAVELRDTGRQGFMLSNRYIIPNAEENLAGVKAVAHFIKEEELKK